MIGVEVAKMHGERQQGFYQNYCAGEGLDIGYSGMMQDCDPVLPNAKGIDLRTPGYNGVKLPLGDCSQDFVWASHVLEHIGDYAGALQEWHRVVKPGGHILIFVPHAYLYERSLYAPGPWGSCADHKRTYTPSRLLREVEESLRPNTYRVVHLKDNDKLFNYGIGPQGIQDLFNACFEIELVIKKLEGNPREIIL